MNLSSRKLEVRDLVKSYRAAGGRVQAVRGVSFSLHKGEILALIGPNGSGKTTTLQCISGLTLPDKGQILLDVFWGNDHQELRSIIRHDDATHRTSG
jgi:ABC-type multidrug transport system ATPase subunit